MGSSIEAGPATPHLEELVADYRTMRRIRQFEDRAMELYHRGEMPGLVHAYSGQEAVAVGLAASLRPSDTITSTHRGHGHCIAKGVDLGDMMAENLGRATGVCAGKGGSMHIADVSRGILGANGIVAGGVGIALGAAFSAHVLAEDRVSLCFLGDGAMNQGVVYETMNMAALWALPLVYVCEYNGFTEYTRSEELISGDLLERARAFGVAAVEVDGMDVRAVREVGGAAIERARRREGPILVLAWTHRYHGHHVAEFESGYRQEGELEQWQARDPIDALRTVLVAEGIESAHLNEIDAEVAAELDAAVAAALAAPLPEATGVHSDVTAEVQG